MNEPRQKPVYGMQNHLHAKLDFIRWALDEAKDASDLAQRRIEEATQAMGQLLSEDGEIFQLVRCVSCRTSWVDEREAPKVTHCPMCGKKAV